LRISRISNYIAWGLVLALLIAAAVVNHFFNRSISGKDSQAGVLSGRLADAQKQVEEQAGRISELTKRRDDLLGDRERLSAQRDSLQSEKKDLGRTLDNAKKDRDDNEIELKAVKKSLETANVRNGQLAQEIIDLKVRLAAASQPASASAPAKPN
ncbi:MAG: hypothetical protein HZA50_00750, partial [Planctomycetes bacterium]|nr:hypothetical protein [Planctomycetota bacterium]